MEAIFIYFGKMILCSAVMFGYYHLVLKDKTFHHYNRFYLLSIVVVSLFLPLVKVSYFTLEVNNDIYLLLNKIQNNNSTKTLNNDFFYFRLAVLALGLVSVVLLGKLIFGLIRILRFKKEFPKEKIEGISFYQTNLENAPFSFFRNLFWKNSILLNSDLGRQILKHEMVHIEQKHTIDKIVMEVFTGLLWFNPIFWFIKKEIHLIHEYLADKKAVKHMDTKAFAQMLLASHFSGTVIPATSPFLNSNLKKRLKMLQKPNTKFGYVRRIMALPLVFSVAFVYMVNAKNKEIIETNEAIAIAVSEMKTDTVKAKLPVEDAIKLNQEKLEKASERIKKDNEKINALAEQTREKSTELKAIEKEKGVDNAEYTAKVKEIQKLGDQIDKIANSESYWKNWKEFDLNSEEIRKHFQNPDLWKELRLSKEQIDKMMKEFNSTEGRATLYVDPKNLEKLKNSFDSDEWKKTIELLQKNSFETPSPPEPFVRITPQNSLEIAKKAAERAAKQAEIAKQAVENSSRKERAQTKKTAELAKQRAKLAAERAELARQQMELLKKEAELKKKIGTQNNPWIIGVGAHEPASKGVTYSAKTTFTPYDKDGAKVMTSETIDKVVINTPDGKSNTYDLKMVDGTRNYKIYIDDKEVSKEEMSALSPKHIKSVSVYKRSVDSKRTHDEIRINTKD